MVSAEWKTPVHMPPHLHGAIEIVYVTENHSTSVAEILKLNNALIKNPDSIHVGWKIRVK